MKTFWILVMFFGTAHQDPSMTQFGSEVACRATLEALGERYLDPEDRVDEPGWRTKSNDFFAWKHSDCIKVQYNTYGEYNSSN